MTVLVLGVALLGVLVAAKRGTQRRGPVELVGDFPKAARFLHASFESWNDGAAPGAGRAHDEAANGWGVGVTKHTWLKVYTWEHRGRLQRLLTRLSEPFPVLERRSPFNTYTNALRFFEQNGCPALLMGPSVRYFVTEMTDDMFDQPIELDFVVVCENDGQKKQLEEQHPELNFFKDENPESFHRSFRNTPMIFFPSNMLQNTDYFRWSVDAVMLAISAETETSQIFAFGEHGMHDMQQTPPVLRPMLRIGWWNELWRWAKSRSSSRDLLHTDYLRMLMKGWHPDPPCFRYFMQNFLVMQADVEHEQTKQGQRHMAFSGTWCKRIFGNHKRQIVRALLPGTRAGLVRWAKDLKNQTVFSSTLFMNVYMRELTNYFTETIELCKEPGLEEELGLEAKTHCMKDGERDAREHAKNIIILGAYGICYEETDGAEIEDCKALDYDSTFASWFAL